MVRYHGAVGTYAQAPVSGVTITVKRLSDGMVLGTATSASDGAYSVSITTGGTPIAVYAELTKSGYVTSYSYPADALDQDSEFNIPVFTPTELQFWYTLTGAGVSFDNTKGTVAVGVTDCNDTPIENATINFSPTAAGITYMNDANPPMYRTSGTYSNGLGLGLNVAATAGGQSVTVGAAAAGRSFKSHSVKSYPGQVTITLVHP